MRYVTRLPIGQRVLLSAAIIGHRTDTPALAVQDLAPARSVRR
jgi:hypothetical protein